MLPKDKVPPKDLEPQEGRKPHPDASTGRAPSPQPPAPQFRNQNRDEIPLPSGPTNTFGRAADLSPGGRDAREATGIPHRAKLGKETTVLDFADYLANVDKDETAPLGYRHKIRNLINAAVEANRVGSKPDMDVLRKNIAEAGKAQDMTGWKKPVQVP